MNLKFQTADEGVGLGVVLKDLSSKIGCTNSIMMKLSYTFLKSIEKEYKLRDASV